MMLRLHVQSDCAIIYHLSRSAWCKYFVYRHGWYLQVGATCQHLHIYCTRFIGGLIYFHFTYTLHRQKKMVKNLFMSVLVSSTFTLHILYTDRKQPGGKCKVCVLPEKSNCIKQYNKWLKCWSLKLLLKNIKESHSNFTYKMFNCFLIV